MKRILTTLLALLFALSAFACQTEPKETDEPTAQSTDAPTEAPTEAPTAEPTPEPASAVLDRYGRTADHVGRGQPEETLGEDGETYIDASGLVFYVKADGSWTPAVTLKDAHSKLVRLIGPDGTELKPQLINNGDCVEEPELEPGEGAFLGWFAGGYDAPYSFDAPVSRNLTLKAIRLDTMEKTATLYTEQGRSIGRLRKDEPNGVAVFFIGFTDGLPLDKDAFEDRFKGDYPLDECLNSVASYYRYNSYGRASFEFHFFYCDTGMTSKEGYDAVQKQYNKFFTRIVDRFRKEQPDAIRACDKDGDGNIDLAVVIGGEDPTKTVGDGNAYYLYGGSQGLMQSKPNTDVPTLNNYLKLPFERLRKNVDHADQSGGTRILIHEIGHAFGLEDHYDVQPREGEYSISTLGGYDMQECDVGDWNPYSKFSVGWLDPYVITEDVERITLKLGCSSETGDAILIPTSNGWNGTPFDEYILVDVMAPKGANAFDWNWVMDGRLTSSADSCADGGVRVIHVDARLLDADGTGTRKKVLPLSDEDLTEFLSGANPQRWKYHELWFRFYNSNGVTPYLEGDSSWHHRLDLIPRDGSSKFRLSTPISWAIYTPFCVSDLFAPGSVFSMETCADAFADAPYMNNGGTLDYSVTVEHYDRTTHEAIVTVERIAP